MMACYLEGAWILAEVRISETLLLIILCQGCAVTELQVTADVSVVPEDNGFVHLI